MTMYWQKNYKPVPYPIAVDDMIQYARKIRQNQASERVWLLEHNPVFTAGTSTKKSDLSNPCKFPIFYTGRGGQWTYHGPGQRVAYVQLDLTQPHGSLPPRDIRAFVYFLEEWLIRTIRNFGVQGERRKGRIGVWVVDPSTGKENKIAAIGIRISQWVTLHGVSLNVCPNLSHYDGIIPCGIKDHGVASLKQLGYNTDLDEIDKVLESTWSSVLDTPLQERI